MSCICGVMFTAKLMYVCLYCLQTCDVDLDTGVGKTSQSAPYIIITGEAGQETTQYFIACEKAIFTEAKSILDAANARYSCCAFTSFFNPHVRAFDVQLLPCTILVSRNFEGEYTLVRHTGPKREAVILPKRCSCRSKDSD